MISFYHSNICCPDNLWLKFTFEMALHALHDFFWKYLSKRLLDILQMLYPDIWISKIQTTKWYLLLHWSETKILLNLQSKQGTESLHEVSSWLHKAHVVNRSEKIWQHNSMIWRFPVLQQFYITPLLKLGIKYSKMYNKILMLTQRQV